jgi:hypothetical protein
MVLGQGVLYLKACVVEIFSFIAPRSLVHRGGFKGQWGVDSVDLYYAYALEKCMERNVLSPKISLCSFAIDHLNSDSTKRQLHGIRTAHNPSTEGSNQDTAPCEAQCIDRGDDHTNEDVAFDRPSE